MPRRLKSPSPTWIQSTRFLSKAKSFERSQLPATVVIPAPAETPVPNVNTAESLIDLLRIIIQQKQWIENASRMLEQCADAEELLESASNLSSVRNRAFMNLVGCGVPLRLIASVADICHQRVSQAARSEQEKLRRVHLENERRLALERAYAQSPETTKIVTLSLSVRARNVLLSHNIKTVGDLLALTRTELARKRGVGTATVEEISAFVRSNLHPQWGEFPLAKLGSE